MGCDLGFHEDGFTSGIHVASTYFGASLPFEIQSPDRGGIGISRADVAVRRAMGYAEWTRRVLVWMIWGMAVWLRACLLGYSTAAREAKKQ